MSYKDRIRVHIEGKEYSVVGGDFQAMLAAVKQINGRRFVSQFKVWQLPGSADDIQNQLEITGFTLEGGKAVAEAAGGGSAPAAAAKGRDRIRVRIGGQSMAVVGGSFQEMLAVVKSLPERRFDGEAKVWEISGDVGVIQGMIQAAGYDLEGAGDVPQTPVSDMEPPPLAGSGDPPPFEPPNFAGGDDTTLPFEPPDWLDDEQLPPPPEPPDWWDDETEAPPTDFGDDDSVWEEESSSAAPATPLPSAKSAKGDRIRVRVGGIPMVVSGSSFQDMLAAIKQIPGRRFDGQDKVWDIPAEVGLDKFTQLMNASGFEVGRG